MSQQPADPNEFQNLPFEPEVGKYSILANVKHGKYVVMDQVKLPADLFYKHQKLLTRSVYERIPSKQWDVEYAAFANHMKDIKQPELNPEKWIAEAEKIIPYGYLDRVTKPEYFPPYQQAQYNSILELISRTRAIQHEKEQNDTYVHAHSFTKKDVSRFFETPYPAEAVIAFPTVPAHQREQWFDLLMHFAIGAAVQPEAENVKRCFDKETRLLRDYHHTQPCLGAGTRYAGGIEYWRENFDRLYEKVAPCADQKTALRYAMISEPDFSKAKIQYDQLLRCLNTRQHKIHIIGTIAREKQYQHDRTQRFALNWIQQNLIADRNGEWGPRTANPHMHSQEQVEAAKQKYQEAIQFKRDF